ncbi:MAG: hypothetical protein IJD77_02835 [Clostridia bacterium]|nr:hypothetical protein [Clostridia bacterium]
MKKEKQQILYFESFYSPQTFIEHAHHALCNEKYTYFSRTEKGFVFQIDANHGGKVYLDCEVIPNENSGSIICGKIVYEPWKNGKETIAEKIRGGVIIFLISVLLFPLVIWVGISNLISRFSKKRKLTPHEKKAVKFMTEKLNCTHKTSE